MLIWQEPLRLLRMTFPFTNLTLSKRHRMWRSQMCLSIGVVTLRNSSPMVFNIEWTQETAQHQCFSIWHYALHQQTAGQCQSHKYTDFAVAERRGLFPDKAQKHRSLFMMKIYHKNRTRQLSNCTEFILLNWLVMSCALLLAAGQKEEHLWYLVHGRFNVE